MEELFAGAAQAAEEVMEMWGHLISTFSGFSEGKSRLIWSGTAASEKEEFGLSVGEAGLC